MVKAPGSCVDQELSGNANVLMTTKELLKLIHPNPSQSS
jgi:hypothetical protein